VATHPRPPRIPGERTRQLLPNEQRVFRSYLNGMTVSYPLCEAICNFLKPSPIPLPTRPSPTLITIYFSINYNRRNSLQACRSLASEMLRER
jgi:hypothetical protein